MMEATLTSKINFTFDSEFKINNYNTKTLSTQIVWPFVFNIYTIFKNQLNLYTENKTKQIQFHQQQMKSNT